MMKSSIPTITQHSALSIQQFAILHMYDPKRRSGLPAASGEVGNVHGGGAALDGAYAQFDDGAEGSGIVDVHVGRLPFAKAFDQSIVLDEIHTAVPRPFRVVCDLLP